MPHCLYLMIWECTCEFGKVRQLIFRPWKVKSNVCESVILKLLCSLMLSPHESCQSGTSREGLDVGVFLCALISAGPLSLAPCGGLFSVWSDWAPIEWHNCLPSGGWLALSWCQTGSAETSHWENIPPSSSTSQISCCLPKIRIITAAHPASHCHVS